jgi:hypothetical protein
MLALMESIEDGAITRRPGVLEQVGRHGDRLVRFLWNHRRKFASTATLATVLRDVTAYLDGSKSISPATDDGTTELTVLAPPERMEEKTAFVPNDSRNQFPVEWGVVGLIVVGGVATVFAYRRRSPRANPSADG